MAPQGVYEDDNDDEDNSQCTIDNAQFTIHNAQLTISSGVEIN